MIPIFVDTAGWAAAAETTLPEHHTRQFVVLFSQIGRGGLVTTSLVITETFAFDSHFEQAGFVRLLRDRV